MTDQPGRGPLAKRRGPSARIWLLLAPLVCCGGPLLIGALTAAGVLVWVGLGLAAAAVIVAAVALAIRRRTKACRLPGKETRGYR